MAQTLVQLTAPLTVDQCRALLLLWMQGLGVVIPTGTGAGSTASGTGSLTLSGTPTSPFPKVLVQITTPGEQGTAVFQYSLNGGSSFTTGVTVPAAPGAFTLPGTGVVITFNSGPAGAGTSFALGDQFAFALNTPSLPVTAWPASGMWRALVEMEAQFLAFFSAQQAAITAAGLTTSATSSWADLLGQQFYGLPRNQAAVTAGQVTLTDAAGAGPFTITAGTMWFASVSGQLYSNTTGGTLPKNGTLVLQVAAQQSGSAYNVANGTITSIVAGMLAGVTVANPDPGTGTWITSQGSDQESTAAYMQRCQQRWPSLSTGATAAVYQLWALSAEAAAGHATTITRALVIPDPTTPGQVDVYLAGASGGVGGGAVTDAQNYINQRVVLTTAGLIQSAANAVMTVAGQVNFYAAKNTSAAVQAAVAAALSAYVNSVNLGSDAGGVNAKVFYTEIEAAIGAVLGGAGVAIQSIGSLTLNGGTADVGLTIGQVAVLTNSLTFNGV